MKKRVFMLVAVVSFFAIFPLSVRVGDIFFTHPFDERLFDPVLLVCPDHVEALRFHEIATSDRTPLKAGCTFQVAKARQGWVENAVRNHLEAPIPNKASWVVHVKQLEGDGQRIQLELFGDGLSGMIYEVRHEAITPLKSRLTGPGGAIYILAAHFALWIAFCVGGWLVIKLFSHRRASIPDRR